jgi:hypothetical protein
LSAAPRWRNFDLSKLDTLILGSVLLCAFSGAGFAPRWIDQVGEILLFAFPSMILTILAMFPPDPQTVVRVKATPAEADPSDRSPQNLYQNLVQQGK